MTDWIMCDLCGDMVMHPKHKDAKTLDNWLMMGTLDFCEDCTSKLPFVKFKNGSMYLEKDVSEEYVANYIRDKGL